MQIHSLFLVASATLAVASFPDESTLPGCGETCFDSMLNQASALGCPAEDPSCLCGVAAFKDGIISCAGSSCATDLFSSVTNYMYSVCNTATLYSSSSTTSYYASTTAIAETTPMSSTYMYSTSSPTVFSTAVDSTSTSSMDVATIIGATTSTNASTSASSAATTSHKSSQSSSSASKTSSTASSTSASASASSTAEAGVLSTGAKAGIGIGVSVGAVALIAALVALCITRKHKRDAMVGTFEISNPMPGSGRVYPNEQDNVSELEMKSRRYEDMVPHQVPRTMV